MLYSIDKRKYVAIKLRNQHAVKIRRNSYYKYTFGDGKIIISMYMIKQFLLLDGFSGITRLN